MDTLHAVVELLCVIFIHHNSDVTVQGQTSVYVNMRNFKYFDWIFYLVHGNVLHTMVGLALQRYCVQSLNLKSRNLLQSPRKYGHQKKPVQLQC